MKDIYQVPAYNKSPRQAAEDFAREYFDKPRQIEDFKNDRFTLVDGRAEYAVILVPGKRLLTPDVYRIYRIDSAE